MIYVIADIHGCYDAYQKLLDKIHFSMRDDLYVLGDVCDRGPEPVKVLQDMMMRPNVFPILGNHDYMALTMLSRLDVEITAENAESYLSDDDLKGWMYWMQDGGSTTVEKYLALSPEEREDMLDYLSDFALYADCPCQMADGTKHRYILCHAGLSGFDEKKPLQDYSYTDLIFKRPDLSRRYFSDPDTYIVTGHTPTLTLRKDRQPLIIRKNGNIMIDCGYVFGGQLAAYCLNTGEVTYVK